MTFQTSNLQKPSPKFHSFLNKLIKSIFFIFFFYLQISFKKIYKHNTKKHNLNLKLKQNSQIILKFSTNYTIYSQTLN